MERAKKARKCLYCKACYTLFTNNDERKAKWQKNIVQRIVYSKCSPCLVNRFFAVCRGGSLFDEHKGVFCQKYPSCEYVCANNERCEVARSPCFCEQYFVRRKNGFVPYSSCLRIVHSELNKQLLNVFTSSVSVQKVTVLPESQK